MTTLFTAPIQPMSGFPALMLGRYTWECPIGQARLVLDHSAFDYHLDIGPDAPQQALDFLMELMTGYGFTLLDDDECDPELLDDDFIRVYFRPTIPVDDSPLIPVQRGEAA